MSPDNQPAKPDLEVRVGNRTLAGHQPATRAGAPIDPRANDGMEILGMILRAVEMGCIATSPMIDSRTGTEYVGLVIVHPDDREDALLSGAGRKMPAALLLTNDVLPFIKPAPRPKSGSQP